MENASFITVVELGYDGSRRRQDGSDDEVVADGQKLESLKMMGHV
jgi:hypothetical protein